MATKYRIGRVRQLASGAWRADIYKAGKPRIVRQFKTQSAAKAFIDGEVVRQANDDHPPLTARQLLDAQEAIALLPPGATLAQAARALAASGASFEDMEITRAVDLFIADKVSADCRHDTISAYRTYTNPLRNDFKGRSVADVSTSELVAWLDAKGQKGRNRNNYRNTWRTLWAWAIARGYARFNPALGITKAKETVGDAGIFTPDEAKQLLRFAVEMDPPLVRSIAIGLFAGLRPKEIERLTWPQNGPHATNSIRVDSSVAKTREKRHVKILPVLRAWLDAYPSDEPLCGPNYRHRMKRVRDEAKVPWPHDVLRHSFASYHLALFRDEVATQYELGHADRDILYNHYRDIVTHEDAVSYFSIMPNSDSKMVESDVAKT